MRTGAAVPLARSTTLKTRSDPTQDLGTAFSPDEPHQLHGLPAASPVAGRRSAGYDLCPLEIVPGSFPRCIPDVQLIGETPQGRGALHRAKLRPAPAHGDGLRPVSYTHLTLPTILRV